MIKPFPSDRIGMEIIKKREAKTCVWRRKRKCMFGDTFLLPECGAEGNWSVAPRPTVCQCGKRVEVKK